MNYADLVLDAIYLVGLGLVAAGVYMAYGTAAAMIVGGTITMATALRASRIQEERNAADPAARQWSDGD